MIKCTLDKIMELSNELKIKHGVVCTNYYGGLSVSDVSLFDVVYTENCVVFGFKDNYIYRLFFFANNISCINECLKEFPRGAILEWIYTENVSNEIGNIQNLKQIDSFRRYKVDLRNDSYKEKLDETFYKRFINDCGEVATLNDFEEMNSLINTIFDKRVSHLPSQVELNELIKNGNVIVCRKVDKIKTFWIYKIEGKKIYSYQAYNSIQGTYIQSVWFRLFEKFASENFREVYAWVSDKNIFSLNLHFKFNFEFDRLYLRIFELL